MLTLPTQQITPAWHEQLVWRQFLTNIFRVVSRRRDFTTEYRKGKLIAGVIPSQRRLLINPALVRVPGAALRFDPRTEHDRRVRLLRGIAAHEAGHVMFSARKPTTDKTLGWMWNALEDERMERLVIRRFPELAPDFAFLGDAMYLGKPQKAYDLTNACLVWRWAHDCPLGTFHVLPQHEALWETRLRPLVEESWDAHRDDVALIAQEILDLIPMPTPEDQREENLGADGGGMTAPQKEEGQPKRTPQSGGDKEPPRDPQTQGDPAQSSGNEEAGEDEPDGDAAGGREEEQEGEPQEDTGGGGLEDDQVSDDPCSASGADSGDEQGGSSTQDGEGTPDGDDASEQAGDPGGEGVSDAPLPHAPPAPPEAPSDELLSRTEGYARRLSPILAPPVKPAGRTPHRSRGSFQYDRYQQGAERYFRRKTREEQPAPFQLRLCVDLSSSMVMGGRLEATREAALMLTRAALLAQSRVTVIGFTHEAREVVPLGTSWEEATRHLQGMRASGTTQLAPALTHALNTPARPDERVVVIIITDGELAASDVNRCAYLLDPHGARMHSAPKAEVIPILIGEACADSSTFMTLFGMARPVRDLDGITQAITSALTILRARTLSL